MDALPADQTAISFVVSWSGADPGGGSGIVDYDVQYRIEDSGGWLDWLLGTFLTSSTFGPFDPIKLRSGQTYHFRSRARDEAGNLEDYPGWQGDTWTTVHMFDVYLPVVVK